MRIERGWRLSGVCKEIADSGRMEKYFIADGAWVESGLSK